MKPNKKPPPAETNGPLTERESGEAILSDELLQGQTEVTILHNGQPYRLRCTKNGKLILTK